MGIDINVARCRYCTMPILGDRAARKKHIDMCPCNPRPSNSLLSIVGVRKPRTLKPVDPIKKKQNLEKLGWEIASDLISKANLLVCTRCLHCRYSFVFTERDCDCGWVMILAKDAIEDIRLDGFNLPKNF